MVDTSPEALSEGFSNLFTGNLGPIIVQVIVWLMVIGGICAIMFVFYIIITYKYKFMIVKVYGDGKGGMGIGKPKFDLAREMKDGSLQFLFRRKVNLEPFKSSEIYPGNWMYVYDIDGKIIPGRLSTNLRGSLIEPVSYADRKKVELELQQNALDFAKVDAWEANKIFIYTLIGAGMVIVLAGFVLWLSFKKTDAMVPAMQGLTDSMKNFNTISGKG